MGEVFQIPSSLRLSLELDLRGSINGGGTRLISDKKKFREREE